MSTDNRSSFVLSHTGPAMFGFLAIANTTLLKRG